MEYEIRDVPLDDFPGYRVSSHGEVWGKMYKRPMRPDPDKDGYLRVQLRHYGKRRTAYVAQLVLLAFHGPKPDGCEAMHTPDPTRTNNRADNLRWGTREENQNEIDRESHPETKLTRQDVIDIRASQLATKELAAMFLVCEATIGRIKRRESWAFVE